ncbi:MAG: carboxypeptidase regulatory-like domain-containing protein [Acidobacteria bacterium]|nr:carboxypeptidase regulatory-like domain-containing protein [Acidobacteriota bacterium]
MADTRQTNGEWLTGILENLAPVADEKLEPLQQIRELQASYRVLLQNEAERLKKAYGENDSRVLEMQHRLRRNLAFLEKIEVEDQIRQIQVKEYGEKESLIQGRLVDESSSGLAGYTIELTDESGKAIGVAEATVDATGYFAAVISEEQADRLATAKIPIYMTIKNKKGEVCERRPVSQTVGAGVRVSEIITLPETKRIKTATVSTRATPAKKTSRRKK